MHPNRSFADTIRSATQLTLVSLGLLALGACSGMATLATIDGPGGDRAQDTEDQATSDIETDVETEEETESGGDSTTGCPPTEMEDCNGICVPATWLGDGACDLTLDCATTGYDAGDCEQAVAGCPSGEIEDCSGACVPQVWIGDGNCNSQLDCASFSQDGGDCVIPAGCPTGEIEDCDGNCVDPSWVGDGFCDNGSYEYEGVLIFLDCPAYNDDECDCTTCPTGEVPDCNCSCVPESWLADGLCDNGTYTWDGNPIYLDCARHNNDAGDC